MGSWSSERLVQNRMHPGARPFPRYQGRTVFLLFASFVLQDRAGLPGRIFAPRFFLEKIEPIVRQSGPICMRGAAMSEKLDYIKHLAPGFDRGRVLQDLMDHFGDDVWRFAYFLTRRADAADDLSQEVFLSAYSSLHAYRGDGSVKGWLLKITRNKALHYLQSAFVRKVTLTDLFTASGSSPGADVVFFDRMESRSLWEAVMSLPRKYRELLILDYHYGFAVKEIAAMTGLPAGTVKSRTHRARKKLGQLLIEDGKEAEGIERQRSE